jgi:hypothetical protein
MIQFRRGSTESWYRSNRKLEPGQPGYDKDKKKIKIGDGESSWHQLPYVGGLTADEILSSEEEAKTRHSNFKTFLDNLKRLLGLDFQNDEVAVITYGQAGPDADTVGQLYLQEFASEPEADYVVSVGGNGGWTYRKWSSGFAECWRNVEITTALNTTVDDSETVYYNDTPIAQLDYPITFVTANNEKPVESATLQSTANSAWLSTFSINTGEKSAKYRIASSGAITSTTYNIALYVKGRWR